MLKFGKISQIDAAKGLARVKFDDLNIVSSWLHIAVPVSYKDQVQFPFFVNQHVYCMMDDQCERGVIGGAIYDETNTPAGGNANIVRVKFENGLDIKYDRSAKKLSITGTGDVDVDVTGSANVQASVKATMKAPVVEIDAPVTNVKGAMNVTGAVACAAIGTSTSGGGSGDATIVGNLNVTGDIVGGTVKEGTIRLGTHKHGGVQFGAGTSGTPLP